MKRWTWFLCAVAVLALAAAAPAAEAAPKAEPAKTEGSKPALATPEAAAQEAERTSIEEIVGMLTKEVKLTADQQGKVREAITAARAAMVTWEKSNADRIEAIKKAGAADAATLQKARDDYRALAQENQALQMKHQASIMEILTPDQRMVWQGFTIFSEMANQLKPLNLTAEQTARCRALCDAAAKEMGAVKAEGEAGAKARQGIFVKLITDVRDTVLTAEQRAKMMPPGGGPGPGPAVAPPTPAPAPKTEGKLKLDGAPQ